MKLLSVLVCLLILSSGFSQPKPNYEAPNLKQAVAAHKMVAILPLKVAISYKKLPDGYDSSTNELQQKQQGISMQQGLFAYLLRKAADFTVSFQDVQRTNVLLKQAGVFDQLDSLPADSICEILKVDAVIRASYAYDNTAAAATAKKLPFGIGGAAAPAAFTIQLHKGNDGTLLWRFYKEMNDGAFTNANDLMEKMMGKVGKKFPYEK